MKTPKTYRGWRRMAERRGWGVPNNDAFSDEVWIRYWQQMYEYEQNNTLGRPIIPHRTGR